MLKKNLFGILVFGILISGLCGMVGAQEQSPDVNSEVFSSGCASDEDCQRPGVLGICQDPGEKTARCIWKEIISIPVSVIIPDACRTCQVEPVIAGLRTVFPGVEASFLTESQPKAQEFIKQFDVTMLPAYIFSREIEREEAFHHFEETMRLKDDYYYLKPEHSGVSVFLGRPLKKNHLDLFLILTQPDMSQAVTLMRELREKGVSVDIHFVAMKAKETGVVMSPEGQREIDENTVYACVEKQAPAKALDFLSCRLRNVHSLWWEDCLKEHRINVDRVKRCARASEGQKLFEDKIKLSDEVSVRYAPLFLMENVEIFGIGPNTQADEILEVLKQKK